MGQNIPRTKKKNRPLWALVADNILAKVLPKPEANTPLEMRINVFLQTWNVKRSAIPPRLRKMLDTAKK